MRVGLRFFPPPRLRQQLGERFPVELHSIGALLTKSTWVLLCSGSYVLFDVAVPEERLRVRIRLV